MESESEREMKKNFKIKDYLFSLTPVGDTAAAAEVTGLEVLEDVAL